MALDLLPPFEYRKIDGYSYTFVSRDGITYHVYFSPMYELYPDLINTYSFSIEPEDRRPHPIDRRIAATVVEILRMFFQNEENAMIMVCDSLDGKERKRRNLFDRWFRFYNDGTMTQMNAEASDGDYELYLSIYFRKTNPYKAQLVKAFNDLLANDLYEMVI